MIYCDGQSVHLHIFSSRTRHYRPSRREGYATRSGPLKRKEGGRREKKLSKDGEFFLGGKSTGVLSNESLTGRTNVWHFLIDLITTITPLTNLHNKICKFWVSSRQIVFHFGQYEFCYGRDRVWIPTRPRLWDCASVAGVGSGRAGAGAGAGATDLSNRKTEL